MEVSDAKPGVGDERLQLVVGFQPGRRHDQPALQAGEQLLTEFVAGGFDVRADRRVAERQPKRGARNAPLFHELEEGLDLAEVDRQARGTLSIARIQ